MFEFSSSLFFWSMINFLVLLFLLHKFALPSFYKMVEENEAKKTKVMSDLEHERAQSAQLLAEYREKLASIEQQAHRILSDAQRERDELRKEETAKLITEKHSVLEGLRGELAYEKRQMMDDLRSSASELVVTLSEKVLRRQLNASEQQQIVESNVQDLEAMLSRS